MQRKPRPILVKFISRETKYQVMTNKKKLKGKKDGVYINEDLTAPRAKMLKAIKEKKNYMVNTHDGKLFCRKKADGPRSRPAIIETPDDLLKLGFEQEEIKQMETHYIKWNIGTLPSGRSPNST